MQQEEEEEEEYGGARPNVDADFMALFLLFLEWSFLKPSTSPHAVNGTGSNKPVAPNL